MISPKKNNLANIPTPVQKIHFNKTSFLIKRDDLTGVEFSGNKVRKLEYILYDAKMKNTDYIFTCGGEQSNHARATAFTTANLGIKSKLFLWGKDRKHPDGNFFMNKFLGAEIIYLDKAQYWNVDELMDEEKIKMESKGKKVYLIPEGGSSPLGIWGYINFVSELKQQMDLNKLKGILIAAGSGGTAAGLLVGLALYGLQTKIFAVNVLYSQSVINEKIINLSEECIREFNIKKKPDFSHLEILDGYSEEGYKRITKEKIRVIKDFAQSTGIILDPAYTGKAFYAYNENFLESKKRSKVMFLHTGGIYGVFSKRKEYLEV